MLKLPVLPGKGMGPFTLGSSLRDCVNKINNGELPPTEYQLKYNAENPLETDIILAFPDDGFHLVFDATSQQLKLVEVYDVSKVLLEYSGSLFCGPEEAPTFVRVFNLFGPTRAGDVDRTGLYYLSYPGVTFTYPLPQQFCSRYTGGAELPLKLPDGNSPIAARVCVYGLHTVIKSGHLDTALITPPPLAPSANHLDIDHVIVNLCRGILFAKRNKSITFDSGSQDALTDFGAPDRIFYKEDDQMAIHNPDASPRQSDPEIHDYFYNYFNHGFDLLFDGVTHQVKKIVLHTNFPSDPDFTQYAKASFTISDFSYVNGLRQRSSEEDDITQDTKWSAVQELLGPAGSPVVHVKGGSAQSSSPTRFFGYPGIIFEVLPNDHIASVTLFADP